MTRLRATALVTAITALAALSAVSTAVAGKQTNLKPFGSGVTIVGDDATVNMNNTGLDGGGVYPSGKAQNGALLNNVVYAFSSQGDVGGGAPRFSIPIEDGTFNPNTGPYAFMDAAGCGATVGDNPGNVATLVSTQNPACHVNFKGVDYANWNALAAAFPTYRIAARAVPFIIVDALPPSQTSATYVMTGIHFR